MDYHQNTNVTVRIALLAIFSAVSGVFKSNVRNYSRISFYLNLHGLYISLQHINSSTNTKSVNIMITVTVVHSFSSSHITSSLTHVVK